MSGDIVCRGCWQLGNNCGECDRCLKTAPDGVRRIRELSDEAASLREVNKSLLATNHQLRADARSADQELRELVLDIRRYVIYHELPIGECVAWNKLKQMTGVGQDHDCPSEDAR